MARKVWVWGLQGWVPSRQQSSSAVQHRAQAESRSGLQAAGGGSCAIGRPRHPLLQTHLGARVRLQAPANSSRGVFALSTEAPVSMRSSSSPTERSKVPAGS